MNNKLIKRGIESSMTALQNWHANITDAQYDIITIAANAIASALQNGGKVLFTGIGKNVHCCEKLAATCASISIDATFFDAVHAMHGDFGMIKCNDVIVAFSKTGNTAELTTSMTYLVEHRDALAPNCKIIGINFANGKVTDMSKWADILISLPAIAEDSRNERIPTNSLLASQLVGDNIMLAVAESIGVDFDRFRLCHPGGGLALTYAKTSGDQAKQSVEVHTAIVLSSTGNVKSVSSDVAKK